MVILSSGNQGWYVLGIVVVFAIIGLVVFFLRKKIPSLTGYEQHDEETSAEENVSRILMTNEEEEKLNNPKLDDDDDEDDELSEDPHDGENK